MALITNKIYICLPNEKEIDKLDWGGLSTEEYNSKTYYKIPSGGGGSDVVKKITFETLKDNVTVKLNIVSSSEQNWDFAYACELDGTSGYNNAKYKISGNNKSITHEYVVPTKGSHWIYIGYRKDGGGNYFNDCGYFSIDNSYKEYVIKQPKEVYLASDKMDEITYGTKKILERGFTNTISWETLTWDKSNNSYTYNTNGPIKIRYYISSVSSSSTTLNTSPSNLPYNGKIYKLDFYPSIISNNTYIMPYKIDLSDWDNSYVNDMGSMFNGFDSLNSINLSKLKNENVTSTNSMFFGCKNLTTLDVYKFNTSKVTDMYSMFYDCEKLATLDVSRFDTSKVTDMRWMFAKCYLLKSLDVSKWNTSNVINIECIFQYCNNIIVLDVSGWNTSKVTDMHEMFYECNNLATLDVSGWNTSKVTNMKSMFYECNNLTTLDVSGWNTSNVTNMYCMFYDCNKLATLDVSRFNTSNVTNMGWMFSGCNNLTTLDVSNWNTSEVTNMEFMFGYCRKLKTLDVSGFNTSKVTNMQNMFRACTSLISLNVSGLNTSNVTNMSVMIFGLQNITSLDVSKWNVSKVTNMDNMFSQCNLLESLDLSRWDVSKVTSAEDILTWSPRLKTIIAGHESEPNVTALNGFKLSIYLAHSDKLNYESVYALFRGVARISTNQTITLPKVMEGKLDPNKVKIATDKGWTVAYK